jgi:hypothetical protein
VDLELFLNKILKLPMSMGRFNKKNHRHRNYWGDLNLPILFHKLLRFMENNNYTQKDQSETP